MPERRRQAPKSPEVSSEYPTGCCHPFEYPIYGVDAAGNRLTKISAVKIANELATEERMPNASQMMPQSKRSRRVMCASGVVGIPSMARNKLNRDWVGMEPAKASV